MNSINLGQKYIFLLTLYVYYFMFVESLFEFFILLAFLYHFKVYTRLTNEPFLFQKLPNPCYA